MGIKRVVDTDFWTDEAVVDQYSPEDRYFQLYLLTNPQSRQLGVYRLPIKIMAFQTGYSGETIYSLLDRFENEYRVIRYSFETQEIAILNYLKYSIVKGGKPVIDCIEKDISQIKDKSLLGHVYRRTLTFEDDRETLKTIRDKLSIYNDNDNDNDNERIVPRFVPRLDESPRNQRSPTPKKKEREKSADPPYPLTEFLFGPELEDKIQDWLRYKSEKKDSYKPTGFKSLLGTIKKNSEKYGEQAVIDLIDDCMANNWKGIIWDRIKPAAGKANKSPFDELLRKEIAKNGQDTNDSDHENHQRFLPHVLPGSRSK